MRNRYIPLTISLAVLLLDFISKQVIVAAVRPHETINILPFLRIVHVKNVGAAFGILSGLGNSTFIVISVVAIIFIFLYVIKTRDPLETIAMSLILGGAMGNLIDRVAIGQVIDFIDFFINKWHWPAFNIADSALTIGIILFLYANLKNWKTQKLQ